MSPQCSGVQAMLMHGYTLAVFCQIWSADISPHPFLNHPFWQLGDAKLTILKIPVEPETIGYMLKNVEVIIFATKLSKQRSCP